MLAQRKQAQRECRLLNNVWLFLSQHLWITRLFFWKHCVDGTGPFTAKHFVCSVHPLMLRRCVLWIDEASVPLTSRTTLQQALKVQKRQCTTRERSRLDYRNMILAMCFVKAENIFGFFGCRCLWSPWPRLQNFFYYTGPTCWTRINCCQAKVQDCVDCTQNFNVVSVFFLFFFWQKSLAECWVYW